MRCDVCGEPKANCFFKQKRVCRNCFNKLKYSNPNVRERKSKIRAGRHSLI